MSRKQTKTKLYRTGRELWIKRVKRVIKNASIRLIFGSTDLKEKKHKQVKVNACMLLCARNQSDSLRLNKCRIERSKKNRSGVLLKGTDVCMTFLEQA